MSDPNGRTRRNQYIVLGTILAGIAGLVGAGMFLFDGQAATPREKTKSVSITPPGTVEDKDVWRANEAARAKANETRISDLEAKLRSQADENQKLSKKVADMAAPHAAAPTAGPATAILSTPLPSDSKRILPPPTMLPVKAGAPSVGVLNTPLNGNAAAAAPDSVEIISFSTPPGSTQPSGAETAKTPGVTFFPAASFVRVAMLNGIDAPTGGQAQSNPLPLAFQVLDTANLANRYKLDIKDCRIIASGWGDIRSERTMARTESLTCIIDGETVELAIKGTVIGEDGKAGIRGRLVSKQGQMLANALFAGSLSGIGKAIQSASSTQVIGGGGITQTVDPSQVAQAGIGGGVSSAAQSLAQYYIKQADNLFPVIETDGGRVVEILITKGVTYTGPAKLHYRGMLRRSNIASREDNDD